MNICSCLILTTGHDEIQQTPRPTNPLRFWKPVNVSHRLIFSKFASTMENLLSMEYWCFCSPGWHEKDQYWCNFDHLKAGTHNLVAKSYQL